MDSEFHSNAHRGDENDNRDGTQLNFHQPHEAKQLHSHERKHQHLKRKQEFLWEMWVVVQFTWTFSYTCVVNKLKVLKHFYT